MNDAWRKIATLYQSHQAHATIMNSLFLSKLVAPNTVCIAEERLVDDLDERTACSVSFVMHFPNGI